MKAIVFRISFFEHLFRNHYTKAFKLSYPTLLPTEILGLIGNICGYDRKEAYEQLKDFYFGATFLRGSYIEENITYIQFKKEGKRYRSGVVKSQVYHNSRHLVVVAGEYKDLKEKILTKIKTLSSNSIVDENGTWKLLVTKRYPYGGWNDLFAKEIRILDAPLEIKESERVRGYAPASIVKSVEENSEIDLQPVHYRNRMEYFIFVKKGKILLNDKIRAVLDIPLYAIEEFNYL